MNSHTGLTMTSKMGNSQCSQQLIQKVLLDKKIPFTPKESFKTMEYKMYKQISVRELRVYFYSKFILFKMLIALNSYVTPVAIRVN